MVVVLRTEEAKRKLLGRAPNLRYSNYQEIGIVPDLTVEQRREEHKLTEEAERRNVEELTPEDISKNLRWMVVGQRGSRRLIKGVPKEHQAWRGRGGTENQRTRGRNWPRRAAARGGITTGANATTLGDTVRTTINSPGSPSPNLLPTTALLPSVENRTRLASKRNREEAEEGMETNEDSEEYEEAEERSPARKK